MTKLIPKKQTAWGKLEYNGPQYSQVIEQMKKEDPQAYNRLQVANARSQQPNSEVVRWKDANGKEQTSTTNIGISGADPIGQLYVEGIVLNPIFKGLGRAAQYGLARAGNKWARAKIINRQMQNISTPSSRILINTEIINNTKPQKRLIMDDKTIPAYFGKKYSVNDVVNPDGTINVRTAQRIQQETAKHYGVPPMQKRTENPVWHKDDPNTFLHTKKVTKNAWSLPTPPGYTKQDQMIAAVGHDFGKIVAGDGHAQAGAGLLKQIFPDLTDDQFKAIYEHMNPIDDIQGNLSKYTKYADIGYKNTQPSN